MSSILDPELLNRLETDVKSLIQTCKALEQENTALHERHATLQRDHKRLQQRNHNAVSYAKALLEQLTLPEEAPAYEHNQ